MGDGGGGHWLVRMEWLPAGWSVCLPLLIFPCTIKSRNSLLAPADPGGPGKRAVKWLCWWWCLFLFRVHYQQKVKGHKLLVLENHCEVNNAPSVWHQIKNVRPVSDYH